MANDSIAAREVVITRLLKAPRELVFSAFTQQEHLAQWWGPDGFVTTVHHMDAKTGGTLCLTLSGWCRDFPNVIKYIEVVKPEKLVYLHGSGSEHGNDEFEVTITFEEEYGNTRLTMRSLFKTAEARDFVVREYGAIERGNETINHLEAYLEKMKA